jgi:hypothetical protein
MDLHGIVGQIDAEIARLQQAKTILSGVAARGSRIANAGTIAGAKRKPGRPAKTASVSVAASPKRRAISAEAKERMRQAQIKRWAAAKKATKPAKANLNATIAPIPGAKKSVTKLQA